MRHKRATTAVLRAMSPKRALLAVLLAATTSCRSDASNADCTPDEPSFAASDACIYGDGQGALERQRCEPLLDVPTSDPEFSEIAALIVQEDDGMGTARGGCVQAICHGNPGTAGGGIHLPSEPAALYATLVSTIGSTVRKPYVVPGDPEATWMHCNMRLASEGGVGVRMPQTHFLSEEDYELLESWILQGARGP
jgi:hypothetical protein